MKFLIDMNLSPLWVSFLAENGFTAIHWSTAGQPWAADSEIFDFAAANNWIVFTIGFRYAPGCVTDKKAQCHTGPHSGRSAVRDWRHVLRAIQTAKAHLEVGALVTVDSFRHRVRVLPI